MDRIGKPEIPAQNQQPPPVAPPKTFNEVTIDALEFTVAEISKHRTALVALEVKYQRLEDQYNALEVKVDDWIEQTRTLPPAA